MGARAKISASGAVSIPQAVRERLAWAPGTELELLESGAGLSLRRAERSKAFPRTTLEDLRALEPLGPPQSVEAISRLSDDDIRRLLK